MPANRTALANQGKERGLKGVLGVVSMTQQPPADAEDHPAMPRHQPLERGLVAESKEMLQKVRIRSVAWSRRGKFAR